MNYRNAGFNPISPRLAETHTISSLKIGSSNWGLGVRCPIVLNKILLCKWSWHYFDEKEGLWKQIIGEKYGDEEGE